MKTLLTVGLIAGGIWFLLGGVGMAPMPGKLFESMKRKYEDQNTRFNIGSR